LASPTDQEAAGVLHTTPHTSFARLQEPVLRLRGGVSTRSTRSGERAASGADAMRSRAGGRRRGRGRGRRATRASQSYTGQTSGARAARPSLRRDMPECDSLPENVADSDAAGIVAAVNIASLEDVSADAALGVTRHVEIGVAGGGMIPEMAHLEAEVRAALASLAISGEDRRSNDFDVAAGFGGGDGASEGGGSDNGMLEVVISSQDPAVPRAIEIATRVQSLAKEERRARVVVREGTFTWRGLVPVIAFHGEGSSDGLACQQQPEACKPVETLLHFSGPPVQPADMSTAAGPRDRAMEARFVGSDGARAHACVCVTGTMAGARVCVRVTGPMAGSWAVTAELSCMATGCWGASHVVAFAAWCCALQLRQT
jgi:hypothetical protein